MRRSTPPSFWRREPQLAGSGEEVVEPAADDDPAQGGKGKKGKGAGEPALNSPTDMARDSGITSLVSPR